MSRGSPTARGDHAAGAVCTTARALRTARIDGSIYAWVTVDAADRDYVADILDKDDRVVSYTI